MTEEWYEKLRCPKCRRTGMAVLIQPEGRKLPKVDAVPSGFEVVKTRNGPDFRCEQCGVTVE